MFECKTPEFSGFKIGEKVRLKCIQVPGDNIGKILSIRMETDAREMAFRVEVKSKECPEANGDWWPIYVGELERVVE